MTINHLDGISVGEYGEPITITVVDDNGNAIDLSGYTGTNQAVLLSPDELKTVTYTTSWATDGTDGQLEFTPQIGDIDREGDWIGQIKLTDTGIVAKTEVFTMEVERGVA